MRLSLGLRALTQRLLTRTLPEKPSALADGVFTDRVKVHLGQLDEIVVNSIASEIHRLNGKWWVNLETGDPITRNVGELLCLIHSEISEAMEGHRKNLMDDKLPHRTSFEVELADAVIRILDLAAGLGLDLGGALVEKCVYNAQREDHTHEARLQKNGKKY